MTLAVIIAVGATPTHRRGFSLDVLLPVVVKDGPEKAQGVFRNVTVDPYNADPMSYIVPLGYLVSIWQKVCFPSYPEEIASITDQQGEGSYDFAEHKKNWLVSGAAISLKYVPDGVDMRFGKTPNVYAGQAAFFHSSASQHQADWILVTPVRSTKTLELSVGLSTGPIGQPVPPPQEYSYLAGGFSGVVKVPYTGLVGRSEVQPTPPVNAQSTFAITWGAQQPKARTILQGGTQNTTRDYYPLNYINWRESRFVPPDPIANGFWWHLKPGVIADITIYGTLIEPGIEATGGESGSAKFNPMKGEELP